MKKWLKRTMFLVVLLLIAEASLRWGVGLGSKLLYHQDDHCEYYMQPNQDFYRFGNHTFVNKHSLRSLPVKKNEFYRILKIGDSVLNGGSHVDQDDLSSTRLEKLLTNIYPQGVRVYNASAGSWGPENAYRFMEKYIDFEFQAMIMVFSSHDAHDNMHFEEVVGDHPAWPDSHPFLALTDVWTNAIAPKLKSWLGYDEYYYLKGFDDSAFNPGWELTYNYCTKNNIPLLVYLHPEISELKAGKYNSGGQEIMAFLEENNIPYLKGIHSDNQADFYIDNIHLNGAGHKFMSNLMLPYIEEMIETGTFTVR